MWISLGYLKDISCLIIIGWYLKDSGCPIIIRDKIQSASSLCSSYYFPHTLIFKWWWKHK